MSSLWLTVSSTSVAGAGKRPVRSRAWPRQAVRSGSTSPGLPSSGHASCRDAGVRNVTFEQADAQVHRFPRAPFRPGDQQVRHDVLRRAGGCVHQHRPGAAPGRASGDDGLAGSRSQRVAHGYPAVPLTGPEGSAAVASAGTGSVLTGRSARRDQDPGGRGFADVTFTDVREPMYFGPDVATALDWIRGFACTREALNCLDPDAAARALGRLRVMLAEHRGDKGVRFDSRAWIVTARR